MMPVDNDALWVPVVLTGVFAGCIILALVLRIPKRPQPPRCRRCGYDLRGSVGDRCSECGEVIAAEAQANRYRRLRRRHLAIALVGGLVFSAMVAHWAGWRLNVIQFVPSRTLLEDSGEERLFSTDASLIEIERRMIDGDLSSHALSELLPQLVDLALNAQSATIRSRAEILLGRVVALVQLDEAQVRLIFDSFPIVFVKAKRVPGDRSNINVGDHVRIFTIPNHSLFWIMREDWPFVITESMRIDGKPVSFEDPDGVARKTAPDKFLVKFTKPGEIEIELVLVITILKERTDDPMKRGSVVYETKRTKRLRLDVEPITSGESAREQ